MLQIGAMVGDDAAIYKLLGDAVGDSAEYQDLLSTFKAEGCAIPEEFIAGIEMKQADVEASANEFARSFVSTAEAELSKGINVDIPINARMPSTIRSFGVQHNAKGTDYSADTFIAGEEGAELITNARGSKVFTAMETGRIFNNFSQLKGLLSGLSPIEPPKLLRIFDETPINGGGGEKYSFQYSPQVVVQGGAGNGDDMERIINQALEADRPGLRQFILNVMSDVEDRRLRLSNG